MAPKPDRPRLGELLVERRSLLPHQLFRALDRQEKDGDARFGTCLLEEKGVDEARVLAELARQHGVPAATAEMLRDAPRSALERVPGRLASRLVAVPFAETAAGLAVAMRDPGDLAARDALGFASGRRIVPHAALELRIYEAIDRHYGEPVPERYRRQWDRMHRRRHLWQEGEPAERSEGGGEGSGEGSSEGGGPAGR